MENSKKLRVAISGGAGFVGSRLTEYLKQQGHTVLQLGRDLFTPGMNDRLNQVIEQCDAVINLAGAPINHRWSEAYKKELHDSRILTTRLIVESINRSNSCKTLISTSAVGYYASQGCYDEDSSFRGNDFLADLCYAWEHEAKQVKTDVRLVITRFGLVLAPQGGAFEKLARSAKLGLAVVIGNGTQSFSWIDREDLVLAMEFLLENEHLKGVFNFTVPERLTQRDLMRQLARHYKSMGVVSTPSGLFKLLYGEASTFMIGGQCIYPKRLTEAGFGFRSPDIDSFLATLK